MISISTFVSAFSKSPLAQWSQVPPWVLTSEAEIRVRAILATLDSSEFRIVSGIAVHRSARIEDGATVKEPAVIGANSFVAAGAYLRAGVWLDARCTLGPGVELKSAFVFAGSTLAHFNFVGDSIIGSDVNLEAGSIVANHRNERPDPEIVVRTGEGAIRTGSTKFGALIGDRVRIGANAVLAPGTLLDPGSVVARLALVDQDER